MSELMSLADLAGADTTDVAEVRFSTLPKGVYGFECLEAHMAEIGDDDKPVVKFKLEVKAVTQTESGKDEVGSMHTETFFIDRDKPEEGIGRIKAFIADAGGSTDGIIGGFGENKGYVDAFVGHQFTAGIKHRANKNDKDNPYANVFFPKAKAEAADV